MVIKYFPIYTTTARYLIYMKYDTATYHQLFRRAKKPLLRF